jgi:hypothetical protein
MSVRRAGGRADVVRPESRLLLRAAALLDPAAAAEAWREFRGLVPEGAEEPAWLRLFPAVCRNLARRPAIADATLRHAYVRTFGANAEILQCAAVAVRALNQARIPVLALKGSALTAVHYRDIGIRPMSDVDLAVPTARIVDAIEALAGAGFRDDSSGAWLGTEMHAGSLSHSGSILDLHRHSLYEARYAAADEAFLVSSQPAEVGGAPCQVMCAEHQILHSVVHGLRWTIAPSDIWILDVITVLRSSTVDAGRLKSAADSLGLLLPVREGLRVARSVIGVDGRLDALLEGMGGGEEKDSERIEHYYRVREPSGLFGSLPNLWFAYRRQAPPGKMGTLGFPAFLARAYRLSGLQQLPKTLLAKASRRLRRPAA